MASISSWCQKLHGLQINSSQFWGYFPNSKSFVVRQVFLVIGKEEIIRVRRRWVKVEVANYSLLFLEQRDNQRTDSYMAIVDCKRQLPGCDGMATSDGITRLYILLLAPFIHFCCLPAILEIISVHSSGMETEMATEFRWKRVDHPSGVSTVLPFYDIG